MHRWRKDILMTQAKQEISIMATCYLIKLRGILTCLYVQLTDPHPCVVSRVQRDDFGIVAKNLDYVYRLECIVKEALMRPAGCKHTLRYSGEYI